MKFILYSESSAVYHRTKLAPIAKRCELVRRINSEIAFRSATPPHELNFFVRVVRSCWDADGCDPMNVSGPGRLLKKHLGGTDRN